MNTTADQIVTFEATLRVEGLGWKVFSVLGTENTRSTALGQMIRAAEREYGRRVQEYADMRVLY